MGNFFIHIPRTGGNSIGRVLPRSNYTYIGHNLRARDYKHPSALCSESDFVFTFVRNPFDRVVSAFHYLNDGGMSQEDAFDSYLIGIRRLTFRSFVLYHLENVSVWQMHFIPQSYYIENVPNVKVFHTENLKEGFEEICKLIGVKEIILKDELVNASNRDRNIKNHYDDETAAIIQKLYSEDFKLFGYPNELFPIK